MKQTPNSLFPYYEKVDLSDRESWREYLFPNNERIVINEPQYLIVSDNGHRIMDGDRICHYVPYGWIELIWYPKEGYGFYCEPNEIDPSEEIESSGKSIILDPVSLDPVSKVSIIGVHITVSDMSNAFLRYMEGQLDNAKRLSNTIEEQTLTRAKKKFIYLFDSWIGEEDELREEEPEQSLTESTE